LKIAGKFNVKDLFAVLEDPSKLRVREARTLNSLTFEPKYKAVRAAQIARIYRPEPFR